MNRVATVTLAVAILGAVFVSAAWAADPPADRVVAMYFHRTQRCPTCLKMGSYSEEAVKQGFAEQVENGEVAFYYIDFQDKRNAALAKGYNVSGPALIVAKIADNQVKEYKDLEDIWAKVREKPEFLKYVRENVEAYLD
jgi:hypothetical protein